MTDLLRIIIAPLIWLASFSLIYGLHGLLCGLDVQGDVFGVPLARLTLILAYGLAILVQIALLGALYRSWLAPSSNVIRFVSHATGWTGLVATVWSLLPVVLTSSC